MSDADRIEMLEARITACGIALGVLLRLAPAEAHAALALASERAEEFGQSLSLTDQQLSQIREWLEALQ